MNVLETITISSETLHNLNKLLLLKIFKFKYQYGCKNAHYFAKSCIHDNRI